MYSSSNGAEKFYSYTKLAAQFEGKTQFFATNIILKNMGLC